MTDKINKVISDLGQFLLEKNKRYGNSVMEPLGIFSKHISANAPQSYNAVLARLDDKLNRIKNSNELRANDIVDLWGYLVFLIMHLDPDLEAMLD